MITTDYHGLDFHEKAIIDALITKIWNYLYPNSKATLELNFISQNEIKATNWDIYHSNESVNVLVISYEQNFKHDWQNCHGSTFIGEFFLNADYTRNISGEGVESYNRKLSLLLIEGLLSIVGYDQDSEETKTIQKQLEKFLQIAENSSIDLPTPKVAQLDDKSKQENKFSLPNVELEDNTSKRLSFKDVSFDDLELMANNSALEELFIFNSNITELPYLTKLKNLKKVCFENCHISDIRRLSNATNLMEISFKSCTGLENSTFPFVKFLTKLTDIEIINCGIDNVSFLNNHASIVSVNVSENPIIELSAVLNMKKIENLHFSPSDYTNEFLPIAFRHYWLQTENLTTHEHAFASNIFNLINYKVRDIFPDYKLASIIIEHLNKDGNEALTIDNLLSIVELKIENLNNEIFSLQGIEFLSNLKSLQVNGFKKINFSFLRHLKKLEVLDIANNNFSSIDFLPEKSIITQIDISDTDFHNLYIFLKMPKLQTVVFDTNAIKSNNVIEILQSHLISTATTLPREFGIFEGVYNSKIWPIKEIFPDETLAKIIAFKLYGMNTTTIELSKLKIIDELSIKGSKNKVTNSKGLEFLPNLKVLELTNCESFDFNILKQLTKIRQLNISSNNIDNLAFLKNMQKLEVLDISNNKIKDMNMIMGLENLKDLTFSTIDVEQSNMLENLSSILRKKDDLSFKKLSIFDKAFNEKIWPISKIFKDASIADQVSHLIYGERTSTISLSKLKKIKHIEIDNIHCDNFLNFGMKFLPHLESMEFKSCKIERTSLSVINKQIKFLKVSDSEIDFNKDLLSHSKLEQLILSNCKIFNINEIGKIPNIKQLDICGCNVNTLGFLRDKNQITKLNISNNKIYNLNPILTLTNLDDLTISPNDVKNSNLIKILSEYLKNPNNLASKPLSTLSKIFDNSHWNLSDIFVDVKLVKELMQDPILQGKDAIQGSKLKEIKKLKINQSDQNTISIKGLEFLINLEVIDLANNTIEEFNYINGLQKIRHLNLANNNLKNIDFMKVMNSLGTITHLNLSNNLVSNLKPTTKITNLDNLTLSHRDIRQSNILEILNDDANKINQLHKTQLDAFMSLAGSVVWPIWKIFPDPNFAKAVAKKCYGHEISTIKTTDLTNIHSLEEQDFEHKVKSFRGIEFLINLSSLEIENCTKVELEFLKKMKNIKHLDVGQISKPAFVTSEQEIDTFLDYFEDKKFASVVAERLEKGPYDLVDKCELLAVINISADDLGIESLEGAQHLKNLRTLSIKNNPVNDLSPIRTLKYLKTLNFE